MPGSARGCGHKATTNTVQQLHSIVNLQASINIVVFGSRGPESSGWCRTALAVIFDLGGASNFHMFSRAMFVCHNTHIKGVQC